MAIAAVSSLCRYIYSVFLTEMSKSFDPQTLLTIKHGTKPIWVCLVEGTVVSILCIACREAVVCEVLRERDLALIYALITIDN